MVYCDLKCRTQLFADAVRRFIERVPRTLSTVDDCKQLVRSSGSVGSNYLEAEEAVSEDDRTYRIKVCRKESRESVYWLELLLPRLPPALQNEARALLKEAQEFVRMFSAMVRNRYSRAL